jgi:hypothetical protein
MISLWCRSMPPNFNSTYLRIHILHYGLMRLEFSVFRKLFVCFKVALQQAFSPSTYIFLFKPSSHIPHSWNVPCVTIPVSEQYSTAFAWPCTPSDPSAEIKLVHSRQTLLEICPRDRVTRGQVKHSEFCNYRSSHCISKTNYYIIKKGPKLHITLHTKNDECIKYSISIK